MLMNCNDDSRESTKARESVPQSHRQSRDTTQVRRYTKRIVIIKDVFDTIEEKRAGGR
jgi:hypothetical protein